MWSAFPTDVAAPLTPSSTPLPSSLAALTTSSWGKHGEQPLRITYFAVGWIGPPNMGTTGMQYRDNETAVDGSVRGGPRYMSAKQV